MVFIRLLPSSLLVELFAILMDDDGEDKAG
jgi:hypothetical protein